MPNPVDILAVTDNRLVVDLKLILTPEVAGLLEDSLVVGARIILCEEFLANR